MAYDNPGDDEMNPEGGMNESKATTIIPPELTGGQKFEAGDIIELKVVSVDEDGSLTVKYNTGDESEGPMEGMDRYFAEKGGNDDGGPGSNPTY